jgi:hypothetical protein
MADNFLRDLMAGLQQGQQMQMQQRKFALEDEMMKAQKKVIDAQFNQQEAQTAWERENPEMAALKNIPAGPMRDLASLQLMGGMGAFSGQPQMTEQEVAGPLPQGMTGPLTTTTEQPQQGAGLAQMIAEQKLREMTGTGVKSTTTGINPKTGKPERYAVTEAGLQPTGLGVQEDLVRVTRQTPQGEEEVFIPKSEATSTQILTGPNKWDEQVFKTESQKMPERFTMARKSHEAVGVYDKLLGLASEGRVTGKWGKFKAWASPYMEMIGTYASKLGIDMNSLSDAELFTLTARALIGEYRIDIIGPGPVSEYEQQLMDRMSAGGGVGQKAALELLERWKGKARVNVDTYNTTARGMHEFSPMSQMFYPVIGGGQKGPSLNMKKGKRPLGEVLMSQ